MIRLFLKAVLKGGASTDLFATQVQVKGHTTEDGTYVAPHTAIRHKRLLLPKPAAQPAQPAQGDLLAAPAPVAAPKPKSSPAPAPSLFDYVPPEKPAPAPDLLLADQATWEAAIYAAATKRLNEGEQVGFSTATRATVITPKNREALRLHDGRLQVMAGKGFVDLGPSGQPIDTLAASLGLPTSYARLVARADSPEHQAADAERLAGAAVELRPLIEAREKARAAAVANVNDRSLDEAHDEAHRALKAAAKRLGVSSFELDDIAADLDAPEPEPEARVESAPAPGEGQSNPPSNSDLPPTVLWGVPAGTSEAARRKLNAAAAALLREKTDAEMTPADKEVLAQYTGNGGCGDSLNEFYTEPDVAAAMWSILRNSGFTGGEVLEPSCGTGVFLRTAPADAHVTGVELDTTSARIAAILHPGHDVRLSSLERFATQDGALFDAVIGNAPFGGRGDSAKGDPDKRKISTHEQYFLDTGLDKLKDGGLMAMVVNTSVMNSKNGRAFRERLLRKAEFLGAHRLPNSAFAAANTDVTTDILLFRKRPAAVAGALGTVTQQQLRATGAWDADYLAGYFEKRGRENVHGTVGTAMRSFGPIYTVDGAMDGVAAHLARWEPEPPRQQPDMMRVLAELGDDEAAKKRALDASQKRPYQTAKVGDIQTIDGVRYILQGDPPRWHRLEASVPEVVTAAIKISEGLDDLLEGRAKDTRLARAVVAEELDEFISQHGLPTKNKELLAWIAAPALEMMDGWSPADHQTHVTATRRRVAALLGAVNRDGSYSDAITGRLADKGEAGLESAAELLVAEQGGFSVTQLAARTAQQPEDVLDRLHASPGFAIEADGKTWTTIDGYLSGELWPKLDAARAAAAHEGLAPEYRLKYEAQIRALEEAISPASLEDVEILLNSGFITPETINAYFADENARQRAAYTGNPDYAPRPISVSYEDGVYEVGAGSGPTSLLHRYLNRTGVKKDERDELERLNASFAEWARSGPMRDEIEERYNRLYKGFRQREYSDAPMEVPGLAQGMDVNAYHFSGLRWALDQGKGVVADDVGLGKTGRGLMLAKLAKSQGLAKKPTFVVPKSVLANWVEETQAWFPGSRVLVIGESFEQNADGSFKRDKTGKLVGKSESAAARREKLHALRQNDYDFVLVSKPCWDKLDLSPDLKERYQEDDFWTKRRDNLPTTTSKGAAKKRQKERDAHALKMAQREFHEREGTVFFDDLGVDMVIMDEAHAYKNLFTAKQRFGMSPKFLGGSGESKTAQHTYFKSRLVREQNGGRGVFMLTATPTKNSPLEIYNMLSHIAPEAFERMGIKNSEDFIDRFVEFTKDHVIGVSGELQEEMVTSGFKNLGELRQVMRRYINRRTADEVGLVIPEPDNIEHLLDMTPEQEAVYVGLRAEAEAARNNKSDTTGESHIFSIMDRMQKASTDLALLGHSGSVSPKIEHLVNTAVKNAAEGGQIIFCEPIAEHETIAAALVQRGVPREQIAIINADEAPDGSDRQRVCDGFNSGKLKFVIGNKTMEQGVNLQKMTSDIHHVDLPWEPATLQQRNGRGRRQGNKRARIRIHTYLAKKSFDVYRHQTIAAKRNWMDLLWNGGDRVENLGREGGFSLADVSIMLSENPEEALAKREADTAAAVLRKQVSDRARAVQSWKRLRAMQANLAKLAGEERGETAAARRLGVQAARARELLHKDPAFPHKDLIDSGEEAIVEPVTGVAWRVGMGMEVAPGPESALKVEGDRPERFVVDVVDAPGNRVWLRSVGGRRQRPVSLTAEQLQNGVAPWTHTEEAEAEEAAHFLDSKSDDLVALAVGHHDLSKVHALPPAVAVKHAEQLQTQIKHRVANHKMSPAYGDVPMIAHGTGKPVMVSNYAVNSHMADHDFMLPIPEHREKAIDAWVNERMGRTVETKYQESGRKRSYGRGEAIGVKASYPSASYQNKSTNPYSSAVKMHGKEAQKEAEQRVHAKIAANIAAAPSMYAAFEAAQHGINLSSLGHGGGWTASTVRALWDKAAAAGVLGRRLGDEATTVEPARYSHGQPSVKPAGHAHFYKIGHENWLDGYKRRDVHGENADATVGTFLWRVAPGDLKAELEAKLKGGA